MTAEKEAYRILVASASDKMVSVVRDVLPGPQYRDISYVSTMGDAKRMLVSHICDILIINTPLKDDFGIQSAIDIAEQHETGILLLVKAEMYEQVLPGGGLRHRHPGQAHHKAEPLHVREDAQRCPNEDKEAGEGYAQAEGADAGAADH